MAARTWLNRSLCTRCAAPRRRPAANVRPTSARRGPGRGPSGPAGNDGAAPPFRPGAPPRPARWGPPRAAGSGAPRVRLTRGGRPRSGRCPGAATTLVCPGAGLSAEEEELLVRGAAPSSSTGTAGRTAPITQLLVSETRTVSTEKSRRWQIQLPVSFRNTNLVGNHFHECKEQVKTFQFVY